MNVYKCNGCGNECVFAAKNRVLEYEKKCPIGEDNAEWKLVDDINVVFQCEKCKNTVRSSTVTSPDDRCICGGYKWNIYYEVSVNGTIVLQQVI